MKVIGNLTKDAIIRAAVSEGQTVTQVIGTPTVFEAAQTNDVDIAYDSNAQKVVIAYKDVGNSNAGTAIVGTVSGNAISFGSPVIFEDAEANRVRITYDANAQKVVIVYQDGNNSDYGTARVGTVSGTSISFGTVVVFRSAGTIPYDITYDSNAQKVVIAQRYTASPNAGYGTVGTVSGTNISFGSDTQFNSASTGRVRAIYDTNAQKVVFAYEDSGNSSHGTAIVGTVSGTSISFGSEVVFEAAASSEIGMAYDSNSQKIVIGYRDQGDSNIGKAIVGTVSGTSISFGTATAFGAGNDEYIAVVYDSDAQKIVVAYSDTTTNGKLNVGTVSGTSISFGDEVQFESGRSDYVEAVYDSVQKRVVIAYKDVGNSSYGTAVVTKTGYSSATGGTIADGKPVIVNANGTVSTVSLTARDQSVSSAVTFESASVKFVQSAFDSTSGKIIVVYSDQGNSGYGTAVVGTVSSGVITFGSPVVFESARIEYCSVVHDSSNNKAVISYTDVGNSNRGTAIVGTVSETSISFGSAVVFDTAVSRDTYAIFDNVNNKIVIVYRNSDNGSRCHAIVGTVSSTSISFGSDVQYSDQNNYNARAVYIGNSKFVTINTAGDDVGPSYVGTVSGTSVSFGSVTNANGSNHVNSPGISYDSTADKVVVAFYDSDNTTAGAVVGTVSGTSISFGSVTNFGSVTGTGDNSQLAPVYDNVSNQTLVGYVDNANSSKGTIKAGTVSGTSISFGDALVFEQGEVKYISGAFDSTAERVVFTFEDDDDSDYGKAVVYRSSGNDSSLTSENFVGFMDGAALDGTNGEILSSCSIAGNQTSLTPGQTYFVLPTGALSTTAGSPSVKAGTAISSKELIVKG